MQILFVNYLIPRKKQLFMFHLKLDKKI